MTIRAFSLLTIKTLDEEHRELRGTATTPSTDRMGDVVEPLGAEFDLPLPLLWQHDQGQPIGSVTAADVGRNGIEIVAKIARIDEPGTLKDRLDSAWLSVKHKLVRGLSIGFAPIETVPLKGGGLHFLKWNWLELSAVTIPANATAGIGVVRSVSEKQMRSLGIGGRTGRGVQLIKPGVRLVGSRG
jgi:HK97 family phage prohead protease